MELSFLELRAKEVINTQDGRKLGKVCDVVLCYPENKWLGIVVPGVRGFGMKKSNLFIDLRSITKVGEDVVLVNVGLPSGKGGGKHGMTSMPPPPPMRGGYDGGRSFEDYE